MKDKRVTIMMVLFLVVASVGVIGFAYSYLNPRVVGVGTENLLSSGELVLEFNDDTSMNRTSILPGDSFSKTFNVKNVGGGPTPYTIGWAEIDNGFINDEIELKFTCKQYSIYLGVGNAGNVEDGTCNSADFQAAGDNNTTFLTNTIEMDMTQEYVVTVRFVETQDNQNYNSNKNFRGVLSIVGGDINSWADSCRVGDPSLRCKMVTAEKTYADNIKSPFVTSGTGINFAQISSNYWTYNIIENRSQVISSSGNMMVGTSLDASTSTKIITLNGTTANVTFTSTDIGKFTCATNSTTCKTAYKINAVDDSGNITNVDIYTKDKPVENVSANGLGLYYTGNTSKTEGGKRVYYYRGAVENNYVIFANFCWRIVRTTEDGNVKLVYGGVPTDGVCPQTGTTVNTVNNILYNNSANDNRYVGYMYGSENGAKSSMTSELALDSTYYYAESYIMNGTNFILSGESINDNWNTENVCNDSSCPVKDYYTCKKNALSEQCSTLYQISSYNNSTSANVYTITYNSNEYANAHENINNSITKTNIDLWYASNIDIKGPAVTNLIADVPYCNDRSIDPRQVSNNLGYGINFTKYAAYTRLSVYYDPTFICKNDNDKFTISKSKGNGELTYPVALLTADEFWFAGATSMNNIQMYLYNNSSQWLMSPYFSDSASSTLAIVLDSNQITGGVTRYPFTSNVRAVISLNSDALVSGGTGIYNNPYVIDTN